MTDLETWTVDGTSRILGVIGDPIAQIKTPEAVNPLFMQRGIRLICVPLHIRSNDLETAWAGLKAINNIAGFGVTLPHKHDAARLCDSLDEAALRVGAVNVVRREADGSFRGYQFDGAGFVAGLAARGHEVSGKACLIVGAGGAATAIAFSLIDAGASQVTIANRTTAKADAIVGALNREHGRRVADAGPAIPDGHAIIVNATSLGMHEDDPLPISPEHIDHTMLVADVIAKPEVTRLLREAEKTGAAIHSGIHMINGQAGLIVDLMVETIETPGDCR